MFEKAIVKEVDMPIFLLAFGLLILGYCVYGRLVEKVFASDERRITPAVLKCDNVDYMVLPTWRVFLIQFLNIAGLGPVFGAILGALYGPVALFWIVLGSIFAGGVHDYMAGMISVRENGKSLVPLVEKYMGSKIKVLFLIFMVFFLLLLGAVFAMSPARMLADMSGSQFIWWIVAIFGYYFLATLLPIDKIIGRFYPLFAVLLLGVTLALLVVLFMSGGDFYPQLTFANLHPKGLPIFPLMFVTIACGALSGFHATQSPLMARCLANEKYGRPIFYGAMITEGVVALVWATLGMAFYQSSEALNEVVTASGPGGVVSDVAKGYLGHIGGMLAVLAVVLLSITSGDTAFRSARLTIGDYWAKGSKSFGKRMAISIIVLSGGIAMSFFDLTTIWTYFGWANQCLATITLWMASFYLYSRGTKYWLTLLPAGFMTAVCVTYIMCDKIGFRLSLRLSASVGVAVAIVATLWFVATHGKRKILLRPLKEQEDKAVYEMFQEIPASENGLENPANGLSFEEFQDFCKIKVANSRGEGLREGYVPDTYYILYINGRPVGVAKLRHFLNEFLLKRGGHIGYGIRPSCRGRKYGQILLAEVLKKAKEKGINKVLITIEESNLSSRKVCEDNGGVLEKNVSDECHYWIDLQQSL